VSNAVTQAYPLEVQSASVSFGGLRALTDVSLHAEAGKLTAIIGPNGAGKSTLLNVVSGFIAPDQGAVLLNGRDQRKRPPWSRVGSGLARTFQDVEIFERLTALENIMVATSGHGSDAQRDAWRLLRDLGLEKFADTLGGSLSYGDQKLLAIARLLATDCRVLLFDEPGAGLARNSVDAVGTILRKLTDEQNRAVVLVEHNMRLVFNYAHFVYVLHHGQLVASGTPEEIQRHPEVLRVYLTGAASETPTGDTHE
jgi:branched-chain amino acid transport system ATP-binding protein